MNKLRRVALAAGATAALTLLGAAHAAQVCNPNVPKTASASTFTDNGDGTVTDNRTGLMWKQCAEGQTSDGASGCVGSAATFTFFQSLYRAQEVNGATVGEHLSHTDWRVPDIKELLSLVEQACHDPAADMSVFPTMSGHDFWSSTHDAYDGNIWIVSFFSGSPSWSFDSTANRLRLVRNAP